MLSNHDSAQIRRGLLDRPISSSSELLEWLLDAQVFYPGDVLRDRFEVLRLMGRGGMGEVYEAFDRERSVRVALKTIRLELRTQQSVVDRFRLEVERSKKVSHPNVCQVYGMFTAVGEDGAETPFFSMELLEGPTLQQEVKHRGPLPFAEVQGIARDICAGLGAAHRCGVVHRDLKCGNVILVAGDRGENRQAKITDFGLARELPSNGDRVITGVKEDLSGTLAYLAPELLEGKPSSKASDVYALGVVLYFMTTGKYPFEADADLISAAKRLLHPPLPPRQHVPSLPRVWERAILASLETNPRFRPQTASEVLRLLEMDPKATWQWAARRSLRHLSRRGFLFIGAAGLVAASWEAYRYRIWPPPFSNRPAKIFVEDLEASGVDQAAARSARNIVRVTLFGVATLHVVPPTEVTNAIRNLNLGTIPLRGNTAMKAAKHVAADVTVGGRLHKTSVDTRVELWAVRVSTGKELCRSTESGRGTRELAAAVHRAAASLIIALAGPDLATAAGPSTSAGSPDSMDQDAVEEFTAGLDYFVHGQSDSALLHLSRATEIDPNFATAWIYQATVAGTQRRDQAAMEAADRAFALRAQLGSRDRLQAEATYCYWTGDYHGWLRFQEQLVIEFPSESHLHRQIAQTYSMLEMDEQAIHHGRQAVELDSQAGNNYMVLAGVLSQSDRLDEALETIETARKIGASNTPALLSAEGVVRMLKGEWEAAQRALSNLEKLPGWDLHARNHICRLLLVSGELSQARDYVASSILIAQSRAETGYEDLSRYWLGILEVLFVNPGAALVHAEALAARDPEPYRLTAFRSAAELAYLAKSDATLRRLSQKLNQISEQHPSRRASAIALQADAWASALAGNRDESVRRMQKARDLMGDVPNTWSLAELLRQYGAFAAAIPLYESVIGHKGYALRFDQQASWVCSFIQVARCYRAIGKNGEAAKKYEQFLAHWGGQAQLALVKDALAERDNIKKG
jgi:serine/threonine protein kinase/tetratricopeptide (TPR) repeat protein